MANPTLAVPAGQRRSSCDGGPTFPRQHLPLRVHLHHVRVDLRLPRPGVVRHHAQDDRRESDIRPIGYGAMLMEGLVGIVALIAAASLPPELYYDINVDLLEGAQLPGELESDSYARHWRLEARTRCTRSAVDRLQHLDLVRIWPESKNGRRRIAARPDRRRRHAGGRHGAESSPTPCAAPACDRAASMKYWYHFAIMFEALFILTTIDTGTRIARFLLARDARAKSTQFERTDWLPGAVLATAVVTAGWGLLI